MRIFAFASVLIGHKFYPAIERFVADQNNSEMARLALSLTMPLFYGGVVGVIVFFLVSGYIITHVLQHERPLEFLVKRRFASILSMQSQSSRRPSWITNYITSQFPK
jgi:peptidoglycan/LPS O-acetylase OafA/YrhL